MSQPPVGIFSDDERLAEAVAGAALFSLGLKILIDHLTT